MNEASTEQSMLASLFSAPECDVVMANQTNLRTHRTVFAQASFVWDEGPLDGSEGRYARMPRPRPNKKGTREGAFS